MRRRNFRSPMLRLSNRRQRLFDSTPGYNPKPKSSFKIPSSDLFLTLVIVISYFLTRISYEAHPIPKFGNELFALVNKTGLGLKPPKNTRIFGMNSHYKRGDRQVSDIVFLSLLAFFIFKVNWNNMGSSTNVDKIAWSVSVLVAPIIINIFIENKNKHEINPDLVSSVKQLKESNTQTKMFLSFALLLTLAVGVKLVHRTINCKGGITKPVLIQIIIIGTTIGLYFLANKDVQKHKSYSNSVINSQFRKEQKLYAEQFENEWPKKHKQVLDRWKEDENKYDNDEAGFVPTSKIIQLARERQIEDDIKYAKDRVTKRSDIQGTDIIRLFNLKGVKWITYSNLNKIWFYIKDMYNVLKEKYETSRIPIPEYLQSKDDANKIISITNDGKTVEPSKTSVSMKKIAYTIISEYLELSPANPFFEDYDKLVNGMKDVIYTKILSDIFKVGLDKNKRFGTHIFNHNFDGVDFKKQFEEELKTVSVATWDVRNYPNRINSKINNTKIIFKTLYYYYWDDKVLDTFEDFIKYHKKRTKENRYKYRNIKGDKPTLEDVKNYDKVYINNVIFRSSYYYSDKDKYIQDHITATTHGSKILPLGNEWVYKDYVSHYKSGKPRNDLGGNVVSLTHFEESLANKSVNQHGWVIAFLLILSFTVCKKDTIDYIIEGSLWGYLIQNVARWDDISPDLM